MTKAHFSISRTDLRDHNWRGVECTKTCGSLPATVNNLIECILRVLEIHRKRGA